MTDCRDCNGWGTKGQAPNATFCDCSDGRQVRQHPQLGLTWLALVNSGKRHPIEILLRAPDHGGPLVPLPPKPANWPAAANPPRVESVEFAPMPPLWTGEENS